MEAKTSHCANDSWGDFAYKIGMKTTIVVAAMQAWLSLIVRYCNQHTFLGLSQEEHRQLRGWLSKKNQEQRQEQQNLLQDVD